MLNSIPFLHRLDSRLEQICALHLKDDSNAHFNKYFILGNLLVMPLMFLLALQALVLDISVLLFYSLGLLTYYLFNLLVFRRFFKAQNLIFVQKTITLIATVIFVYLMGGIMHSGGLILVGIAAVTHTIIFHNYRWMVFEFTLFLAGVAILSLLPNPYTADPPLNQELNTTMFTMTLVGITAYVFILALYAVNLYSQMEKKETVRQKEMSEAKSRLYTNITHEFRTPLTVILGLAEALKVGKASDLHSACDTITRNGNNLLRLVQQLIDLNRLEDGKFEVKYTHGDIIPFIKYLFQLQLPMAKEKNISYDMSSEHPSYLLDFDPDKISTIVSNLLSNAIKFTPTGGKVELNLSATKKELHIAVRDTGVGIPEDKMDKIFDRFYMVNDKSTRQFGGAGIGLSLTKELVVLLQGEISASSEPDVQTTFTVKLPAINLENPGKQNNTIRRFVDRSNHVAFIDEAVHETDQHNKQRLLVIEDNKDIVDFLKLYYQKGFVVDWAIDGRDGFRKALRDIPDIIISDVMMPEMDGFQLCEKLKDDFRTSHIPIILLTAKADHTSKIQGLRQGADAYIVKPFNQEELHTRIEKLLELRKELQKKYSNGYVDNLSMRNNEDRFIHDLISIIQKHISNEFLDPALICREVGMSRSQLYRKFRALTNDSIANYIKKIRMRRARQLLQDPSLNIADICTAVGVKNASTFSRMFKECFGESPATCQHRLQESYLYD